MKRNELLAKSLTLGLAVATAAASMSVPGGVLAPQTVYADEASSAETVSKTFATPADSVGLYEKKASDLGTFKFEEPAEGSSSNEIKVSVTGTAKYQTDWGKFSKIENEQSGYYVPWTLTGTAGQTCYLQVYGEKYENSRDDKTIQIEGHDNEYYIAITLDASDTTITNVTWLGGDNATSRKIILDTKTDSKEQTVEQNGESKEVKLSENAKTYTLDFSGVKYEVSDKNIKEYVDFTDVSTGTFTYSGEEQISSLKEKVTVKNDYKDTLGELTVGVQQSNTSATFKNAGTYDVVVSFGSEDGSSKFIANNVKVGTAVIDKYKPKAEDFSVTADEVQYTGQAAAATATISNELLKNGTTTFVYKKDSSEVTPKDAGTYDVHLKYTPADADKDNIEATTTEIDTNVDLTITKADKLEKTVESWIVKTNAQSIEKDLSSLFTDALVGNSITHKGAITTSEDVGSSIESLSYSAGKLTFKVKNDANITDQLSFNVTLTLQGFTNYDEVVLTIPVTVTAKTVLDVSATNAGSLTYTGEDLASTLTYTIAEHTDAKGSGSAPSYTAQTAEQIQTALKDSGDTFTVSITDESGSKVEEMVNAGTYHVTATYSGTDCYGQYSDTVTVAPKTITALTDLLKLDTSKTFAYTMEDQTDAIKGAVKVADGVTDIALDNCEITLDAQEAIEAKEYTVSVNVTSGNYKTASVIELGKVKIEKADLKLAVSADNTGALTITLGGKTVEQANNEKLSIEYYSGDTKLDAVPTADGTYKVKVTYTDATNLVGENNDGIVTATATFTIGGNGSGSGSGSGSSSSSGGGGSSSSSGSSSAGSSNSSGSNTTTNKDGSTTKTETTTNKDGSTTTTETTTKTDGSTTKTETTTNKDGSTETKTEVKNTDGSSQTKTETVKTDGSKETKTETVKANGTTESKTEVKNTDGSTESKTEIVKANGTTQTKTEVKNADGSSESKTETVKANGTTQTKTEVKNADGSSESKTETVRANGSSEIKTQIVNADNSKETKTETVNADGTSEVKTVLQDGEGTKIVVNTEKDEAGKTTDSSASVKQVSDDKGATISADTIGQVTDAAGTKNVAITTKVVDSDGNTTCKVTFNAGDVKAGKNLTVYKVDKKTGELVMVNDATYKVDKNGNVSFDNLGKGSYQVMTASDAKEYNKQVMKTVKPENSKQTVEQGEQTTFKLDDGLNMKNVEKITYKTSKKSVATVDENGNITTKKSGKVTVKATVTLKNGKKKTVKMTVTVKGNK